MQRVSFKTLKEWIAEWNTVNPEQQFIVDAHSGYYHIRDCRTNESVIVEKTPRRAWEVFCIWKNGYFTGRESK